MNLRNTKHNKDEGKLIIAFVKVKIIDNNYENGFSWKTEIKLGRIEKNHCMVKKKVEKARKINFSRIFAINERRKEARYLERNGRQTERFYSVWHVSLQTGMV